MLVRIKITYNFILREPFGSTREIANMFSVYTLYIYIFVVFEKAVSFWLIELSKVFILYF